MKLSAIAFTMIGIIAVASLLVVSLIPGYLCDNTLVTEVLSPTGERKAIVFLRACSSKPEPSTQVSITPSQAPLPNGVGNTFIANTHAAGTQTGTDASTDAGIRVGWQSETLVKITHDAEARVFLAETRADDVQISYEHY